MAHIKMAIAEIRFLVDGKTYIVRYMHFRESDRYLANVFPEGDDASMLEIFSPFNSVEEIYPSLSNAEKLLGIALNKNS